MLKVSLVLNGSGLRIAKLSQGPEWNNNSFPWILQSQYGYFSIWSYTLISLLIYANELNLIMKFNFV